MPDGPLTGVRIPGRLPPLAGELLGRLGAADVVIGQETADEAMAPATLARALAAGIDAVSALTGGRVTVDGPVTLSKRAAILGLPVAGRRSAGGAAELIEAVDGWFALNLPRSADEELVPALIEGPVGEDHWAAIRSWAQTRRLVDIENRATLLGLAIGALRYPSDRVEPWQVSALGGAGGGARSGLVVNLGSLWAAPLCAQLLRRSGRTVVDIESPQRPDGARLGTPEFYAHLHDGHERAVLDLTVASGRQKLRELTAAADVVLTGSRTAALERLGVVPPPEPLRQQIWIGISGHSPSSNRVAFGDDAAVAGGLVRWQDDGTPAFAGDAIADPLAGLAAALVAFAGLAGTGSWRADVSLRDIAAFATRLRGARSGASLRRPGSG